MSEVKRKKYGGRTKGTPNKDTKELRERITELIDNNFESIQADLEALPPEKRLDFLVKLFEYALPKLNRTEFDSIEDVKVWMIDNQKARRNLTDGWKYELAQVKKAILLEKGREKMSEAGEEGGRGNVKPLSTIDKPFHNTRNEIAASLGWSTGKVAIAFYTVCYRPFFLCVLIMFG